MPNAKPTTNPAHRPRVHTDPDQKERVKKFRATEAEWAEFLAHLPGDSRAAFTLLLEKLRSGKKLA